jgi:regulator of sirC expression with transglutaminase-like and TPR domain
VPHRPISHPLALERLADAKRGADVDVLAAAIAIATQAQPTLKPVEIHQKIDMMAREVRHMLEHHNEPEPVVRHVFADRWGFIGTHHDYHDPANSYIDEVIRRRMGLPISLAVIFVEMARRAGLVAHGVGLPGHFIAALDVAGTPESRLYLDVFHRVRVLSVEGCREAVTASGVPWTPAYLLPLEGLPWTLRMLGNLRTAYLARDEAAKAAAVVEQMLILEPGNVARQQELAGLYDRLEGKQAMDN